MTGSRRSGLIGRGDIDVTVQGHTQLDAGVIASTQGNVALDTGSLGWSDAAGHDRSRSTTIGGSVSLPIGGSSGNLPPPGMPFDTASLDHSRADREQISRATIGAPQGSTTITVRDTPARSLSELNSDLNKAQELTRDTKSSVRVYVDVQAINEVLDGFPTIQAGIEAIAEKIKQAMPNVSPQVAEDIAGRSRAANRSRNC